MFGIIVIPEPVGGEFPIVPQTTVNELAWR
jgi:hypothetical protein